MSEHYEKFRLVDVGKEKTYLIVGARNRLLTVNINQNKDIQITATNWPSSGSLANRNCSNRVLLKFIKTLKYLNNLLIKNLVLCKLCFSCSSN